jgi:hypothetical protein
LSHLGTVFIFTAQEGRIFYLVNSIYPLFQVLPCTTKLTMKTLGTVRVSRDTTETVNFPDDTTVDRHLLSSLPAINVWSCWSPQSIWSFKFLGLSLG